jgi:hypothetical protein
MRETALDIAAAAEEMLEVEVEEEMLEKVEVEMLVKGVGEKEDEDEVGVALLADAEERGEARLLDLFSAGKLLVGGEAEAERTDASELEADADDKGEEGEEMALLEPEVEEDKTLEGLSGLSMIRLVITSVPVRFDEENEEAERGGGLVEAEVLSLALAVALTPELEEIDLLLTALVLVLELAVKEVVTCTVHCEPLLTT